MRDIRSDISAGKARKLSLEEKILRLVRRYRVAEKRRQQKQAERSKDFLGIGLLPPPEQNPGLDEKVLVPFEEAARVCCANTLARAASAALPPR